MLASHHPRVTHVRLRAQGHRNAISCVAATEDRTLLVTADEGPDEPLLVFWDPASCRPLRTLRRPHARGVAALALSPDGSQMATLSAVAPGSRDVQEVRVRCWQLCGSSSSGSRSVDAATLLLLLLLPAFTRTHDF